MVIFELCAMLMRCHCGENLRRGTRSGTSLGCSHVQSGWWIRYQQLTLPKGSVLSLKHQILST